jgi:hypothetical protein
MACPRHQTGQDGKCVCDVGTYNRTSWQIACHEDDVKQAQMHAIPASNESCSTCGACVSCEGASPTVHPDYVRLNLPSRDGKVHIFKCEGASGCSGTNSIDAKSAGCHEHYTGYFCETCIDRCQMKQSSFHCEKCPTGDYAWVGSLLVFVCVAVLVSQLKKLLHIIVSKTSKVDTFMAVMRSAWQPLRTMITYMQVGTQIGPVLNIRLPPLFAGVTQWLSEYVDVVSAFITVKCAGLDHFHYKWLYQVMAVPVAMMCFASFVSLYERSRFSADDDSRAAREARAAAATHFSGNLFFVLFFSYPRVCNYSFASFICRRVQIEPPQSVLVADDRVLCEDEIHSIFKSASLVLIVVIALGVPVVAAIAQLRAKRREEAVPETIKLRLAESLKISPANAEVTISAVCGSSYGFLADAYKPPYYYWESVDMLRKFVLVGVVLIFPRGSVGQIYVTLCVSVLFLVAHVRCWPYKVDLDNYLRAATELHVIVIVSVALAFRTDLDNVYAESLAKFPDDAGVVRKYNDNMAARTVYYDVLLMATFVPLVAGAVLLTILIKMRKVKRVLALNDDDSGSEISRIIAAHMRLELALQTDLDMKLLVEFIDDLKHNEHIRAGKRLWREKLLVAHVGSDEMKTMLEEIEQQLPKSSRLGFHFTDLDAGRVIMEQSIGLRASSVGQLGGGVSICLASLIDLGWEKHGNAGVSFTKKIGEELWGECEPLLNAFVRSTAFLRVL